MAGTRTFFASSDIPAGPNHPNHAERRFWLYPSSVSLEHSDIAHSTGDEEHSQFARVHMGARQTVDNDRRIHMAAQQSGYGCSSSFKWDDVELGPSPCLDQLQVKVIDRPLAVIPTRTLPGFFLA